MTDSHASPAPAAAGEVDASSLVARARLTRDVVAREWGAVVGMLRLADDAAWRARTRLAGWTLSDLVRHTHWGTTLEADGLRLLGTDGAERAAGWVPDVPDTDLPDALAGAADGLVARLGALAAWLDGLAPAPAPPVPDPQVPAPPDPRAGVVPMPYGDVPLALALDVFTMEAAVHRSDIAHALGRPEGATIAPDAVPACVTFLGTYLGYFGAAAQARPPDGTLLRLRGESFVLDARFASGAWSAATRAAAAGTDGHDGVPAIVGDGTTAPTTTLTGTDSAVLLVAYGRLPLDAAPLAVGGDPEHAARLKEYLPGP